jgi:hypothetical protein
MTRFTRQEFVFCVIIGFFLFQGCSENMTKDAGKAVEDAANKANEQAKDVADKAQETVTSMGEKFTAATEEAASSLKDVEGGPEILTQITEFFKTAQESLSRVKDSETAQTAATKLGDLETQADGWKVTIDKLPASAKTAIQSVIQQGKTQIEAIATKASAIPGAEAIIKPAIDALMAKLDSLISKPE